MATVKRLSASEALTRFPQIMDKAYHNRAKFVIEQHGVPMAVVIGIGEYQEWLEDKENIEAMMEALTSDEGEWIDFEEYHKERLASRIGKVGRRSENTYRAVRRLFE